MNQYYKEWKKVNTILQWAEIENDDGKYLPLDSPKAYQPFKKWLPVDLYVGGQEHVVLHLLYAPF